jgi:hypothetical protein
VGNNERNWIEEQRFIQLPEVKVTARNTHLKYFPRDLSLSFAFVRQHRQIRAALNAPLFVPGGLSVAHQRHLQDELAGSLTTHAL